MSADEGREPLRLVLAEVLLRLLCLMGVLSVLRHFGLPDWTIIPAVVPTFAAVAGYRHLVEQR